MHDERKTLWDPEGDPEYGRLVLRYLLQRYRWWLISGVLIGGIVFGTVSIFLRAVYSTSGTVYISKGTAGGSALAGIPLLGGGPNQALRDELAIISSREIGLAVIDEMGLQVEVEDPLSPDTAQVRLARFFLKQGQPGTRRERYTRLTIQDVDVNPDMLSNVTLWITADAEGNWQIDNKTGRAGEPVVFPDFSFRPVFGPQHHAGDRYRLTVKPDFRVWLDYRSSLVVAQVGEDEPKANLVAIGYRHANPILAHQVVQLVIEKYLAYNQATTFGNFDVMLGFITTESQAAQTKLDELMEELKTYQEDNQLFALSAQGTTAIEGIADLMTEKTAARIQQEQINSVLRLIDSRTPEEVYRAIQAPATALPIEASLVEQLANLIGALDQARQIKTEAHPDVQQLKTRIGAILQQIKESLSSNRSGISIAVKEYDQEIGKMRGELARLPGATAKISMLSADIASNQQVLGLLKQNETETKIRKAGTETEVRLVDEPPMPAKKDSPKLARNGVMGSFAGLVLAIVLVLLVDASTGGFRTLRALRLGLGLPVLAVLPGKPQHRKWEPREAEPDVVRRLRRVFLREGEPLAVVHLDGRYPCFDLVWTLTQQGSDGKPPLLVDLDLLDGTLSERLGHPNGRGFIEATRELDSLSTLPVEVDGGRRLLLPGEGTANPEQSPAMLSAALAQFSSVVICLPAPAALIQPAALAPWLKRVVISVSQDGPNLGVIAEAIASLEALGAQVVGVAVTRFTAVRDPLSREELANVPVSVGRVS